MDELVRINRQPMSHRDIIQFIERQMDDGVSRETACLRYAEHCQAELWVNREYVVIVYRDASPEVNAQNIPGLVWLSLRRADGGRIGDWCDLQQIKNQLLGEECEAVQLFPAESRKVDMVNQYHLFGYTSADQRFPFGFQVCKCDSP